MGKIYICAAYKSILRIITNGISYDIKLLIIYFSFNFFSVLVVLVFGTSVKNVKLSEHVVNLRGCLKIIFRTGIVSFFFKKKKKNAKLRYEITWMEVRKFLVIR